MTTDNTTLRAIWNQRNGKGEVLFAFPIPDRPPVMHWVDMRYARYDFAKKEITLDYRIRGLVEAKILRAKEILSSEPADYPKGFAGEPKNHASVS